MNRMTGIILTSIGAILLIVGIVILSKSNKTIKPENFGNELINIIEMAVSDGVLTKNERDLIKREAQSKGFNYEEIIKDVESQILNRDSDEAETELINISKRNGDDFEKFIVHKFSRKYFKIKEWAGDKYSKGRYAETTRQPDLLLEFNLKDESALFSVECKWRSLYYKKGIEFCSIDQLQRYKEYELEHKIPVFIAIGVGGKGTCPEDLFIVPVSKIRSNFLPIEKLREFEKDVKSNFFFSPKALELR